MDIRLSLRRARASDLVAVNALMARSYHRLLAADYLPSALVTALPLISRIEPDILSSRHFFVVEDAAHRIRGAGGWTSRAPDARSGARLLAGTGHVRNVVTDADHLNGGIGRAVMGQVFADALQQGINWLDCLSTRTAVPFFSTLGFRAVSPVDVALAPGIDFPAIRMMRQIRP